MKIRLYQKKTQQRWNLQQNRYLTYNEIISQVSDRADSIKEQSNDLGSTVGAYNT
ncbi:MAG: hypothetical protein K5639_06480 [Eubacterium sp.]|nr:hypothetical protein [Eubacterium sp.]